MFADENENDGPDDLNSPFVDPQSSHQPQPMELDEDEEDTYQSTASQQPPQSTSQQQAAQPPEITSRRGHRHRFFQRSESTLCVGCPPPDPFQTPLFEALPLAEQPQLLQPNARREDLFGTPRQPIATVEEKLSNPVYVLPTRYLLILFSLNHLGISPEQRV